MAAFPNPDTYLNHFPPVITTQFEVSRNLTLVVLGAVIWDILLYIPDDIKVLRRGDIHLVTIGFMTSRFFAVLFVLLSVLQQTTPVKNCSGMGVSIGVACFLALVGSSFLFLQRLRAVYPENRWVQGIFIVLWLATNGLMTTTIYGAEFGHVPGTEFCVYTHVQQYISAAGFMSACFDTGVFLAISYKVAISHSTSDAGICWDTIVSGRALPRLSRSVLQGGQQYYLIVVCLTIPLGILIVHPSTPPIYKLMLSFPLVSLTTSMACRVFRNLKLHDNQTDYTSTGTIGINFTNRTRARTFKTGNSDSGQSIPRDSGSSATHFEMHDMATGRTSERRAAQIAFTPRTPVSDPFGTRKSYEENEGSDLPRVSDG